MATIVKDPQERETYGFDWTSRLPDDSIQTSTWAVPPGIIKESDTIDGAKTKVFVSGGTDGVDYTLVNTVGTANGRTLEGWITFMVREKSPA